MERKLSKICTSCLQPTHLFAAIILLLASAVPVQKVYAAPSHGKAAPAGSSVSGQSPLSAARNEKIVSSPAAPAITVDGDSLEIGSRRIRLMGIDAPEYDQFCKKNNGELYPCGQLAADYLKTLIAEKNITCRIHKQDKYKRDLCTCYAETTDLNAEMIRAGYAVVYLESAYAEQEAEARRSRNGIWNGIFMHPRLFRLLKYHQKKQKRPN